MQNMTNRHNLTEPHVNTLSRRQRDFLQREQLFLDTAREILRRDGIAHLTMDRIAELTEYAKGIKVGDGLEAGVTMGPVISAKHRERVLGYVEKGINEGAKLALDGRALKVKDREEGFFVGPTVFDNVSPTMVIEPLSERRSSMRSCIGERSCASSTTMWP